MKSINNIEELFGTLQQSVVAEWRKHLKTSKYSKHMALDEFYKEMPELIDTLIEDYNGHTGKKVENFKNVLDAEKLDALQYLEELHKICQDGYDFLPDDAPEIKSDLDAIKSKIDGVMYKIRELKEHRMKSLSEYLCESTVDEARVPEITKFTEKEPTGNDCNHFVQANFFDKWFDNTASTVYVDFKDIADTSKEGVWTAFYNLGKKLSSSTTQVGISTWGNDGWEQFANATRAARDRMWHPEWISVKNHPFK